MRALLPLALITVACGQTGTSTVEQVIELVRSGIAQGRPDDPLAKTVAKIKLSERLDDRVIEELESDGAGPRTLSELATHREQTRGLPLPKPLFQPGPAPTAGEQEHILKDAANLAREYAAGLPDFICTEEVARFQDVYGGGWKNKDTAEVRLSFFGGKEQYQTVSVNHKPVKPGREAPKGAIYRGEFGTLLREIFSPRSADFRFDHWTRLRKHNAHVYAYRIDLLNSGLTLAIGSPPMQQTVAQHGFVYIDPETGRTLRIVQNAEPREFPIYSSVIRLDYDSVDVGGKQFVLPVRAELRMSTEGLLERNEITFRDYQKFTGESKITY
jgi:hypothetical protein